MVSVQRSFAVALAATVGLAGLGCMGFFEQPSAETTTVKLRVENATSRFLEVRVTVSALESDTSTAATGESPRAPSPGREVPAEDGPDTTTGAVPINPAEVADAGSNGVEEPPAFITIGLRPEQQSKLALSDGAVRVFPHTFSDGLVACGDLVRITASLEVQGSDVSEVLLEGAGAGTLGFDAGSAGPSGERLLLQSVHFECGATLVLRVSESQATGEAAVAAGKIEVFAPSQTPPEPDLAGGSTTPTVPPDRLEVRISNTTPSFAQLRIATGEDAALDSGSADESASGISVRVPPGLLSTGLIACSSTLVLTASVVVPGVTVGEPDTFNQVVLFGEGTGTAGFDENSVGSSGQQRLLLEDVHYRCGGVIQVEFTFDGSPNTANETLGAATVTVVE